MSKKIIIIIISILVFSAISARVVFALGTGLGNGLPDTYDPNSGITDPGPPQLWFCSCGEAINFGWEKIPLDKLCRSSSASVPYLNEEKTIWSWTCNCAGQQSADGLFKEPIRKLSCHAPYAPGIENGKCGSSNGISTSAKPSTNLCSVGVPEWLPDFADKWNWKCKGRNGGVDALCFALIPEDGICNSAYNGQKYNDLANSPQLCSKGIIANFRTTASGWSWTCKGKNSGKDAFCVAGKIIGGIPPIAKNKKQVEFISNSVYSTNNDYNELVDSASSKRPIFLVSDDVWQDILPLVPVTIWTADNGDVYKYPTLIFQKENEKYDPDSPIHFMQQYNADKVYFVNYNTSNDADKGMANLINVAKPLGANIKEIISLKSEDYFYFWESYDTVVYVENSYELTLHAAIHASLLNAPLIIKDASNDIKAYYVGRKVICIGDTGFSDCSESYKGVEELDIKELEIYKKIGIHKPLDTVFTNPADIDVIVIGNIPDSKKNGQKIEKIYGKHSLMAPFFASAKHNFLITYSYTPTGKSLDCFTNGIHCDAMQSLITQKTLATREFFVTKKEIYNFETDKNESLIILSKVNVYFNGKYYYLVGDSLRAYNPSNGTTEIVAQFGLGLDFSESTQIEFVSNDNGKAYVLANKDDPGNSKDKTHVMLFDFADIGNEFLGMYKLKSSITLDNRNGSANYHKMNSNYFVVNIFNQGEADIFFYEFKKNGKVFSLHDIGFVNKLPKDNEKIPFYLGDEYVTFATADSFARLYFDTMKLEYDMKKRKSYDRAISRDYIVSLYDEIIFYRKFGDTAESSMEKASHDRSLVSYFAINNKLIAFDYHQLNYFVVDLEKGSSEKKATSFSGECNYSIARTIRYSGADPKYIVCSYPGLWREPFVFDLFDDKLISPGQSQYYSGTTALISEGKNYLSIFADPISVSYEYDRRDSRVTSGYSFDSDYLLFDGPKSFVGRFVGYTISDLSSLTSRSIYYDLIIRGNDTLKFSFFASGANGNLDGTDYIKRSCSIYEDSPQIDIGKCLSYPNYDHYPRNDNESSYWENSSHVFFFDHANDNSLNFDAQFIPEMNNSFINAIGCSSAALWQAHKNSFGVSSLMSIRQGATHYLGRVAGSCVNDNPAYLENDIYFNKFSIGEAVYKNTKKGGGVGGNTCQNSALLGDPSIVLKGKVSQPVK